MVSYFPAFVKMLAYGTSVIPNAVKQTATTFTIVGVVTGIVKCVREQALLELEATRSLQWQFATFELEPALHTYVPIVRNDGEIRVYSSVAHEHTYHHIYIEILHQLRGSLPLAQLLFATT